MLKTISLSLKSAKDKKRKKKKRKMLKTRSLSLKSAKDKKKKMSTALKTQLILKHFTIFYSFR